MISKKILIIGGGAAGLLCAITAAEQGASPVILERNPRPARKVMITGKGRCNVTNNCSVQELIASVPQNGRFLYSAFYQFTPQDMMDLRENYGLPLKTERGNRVFPQSDKAVDVVDTLVRQVKNARVPIRQERVTRLILEDDQVLGAETESGQKFFADAVVICTGGASYPQTGSTGDGYTLARQAGHTVTPLRPSLIPFTSEDPMCKNMQGLSLRNIAVHLIQRANNKVLYEDFGEMLFTQFGVSGPVVLSASSHLRDIRPGDYFLRIDLKPALTEEQLDLRLQRDFQKYSNHDFSNAFSELLPQKMVPVFVRKTGIAPDWKVHQLTREMRQQVNFTMKHFDVPLSGFRPIEEAIITSGGVNVKEINPKTMESKLVKGLYFAGEVLDVDAYTGGFNLQIAWSTGRLAGKSAAEHEI